MKVCNGSEVFSTTAKELVDLVTEAARIGKNPTQGYLISVFQMSTGKFKLRVPEDPNG